MAINVNTVYQTVLLILNKEQRGYMTPNEFNNIAQQAQYEIYSSYFADLDQFNRKNQQNAQNDTEWFNSFENALTKLDSLIYYDAEFHLAINGFQAPYFFLTNATITNMDSRRVKQVGNVVAKYNNSDVIGGSDGIIFNSVCEKVTKKEFNQIARSRLTMPSKKYPVYYLYNLPDYTLTGSNERDIKLKVFPLPPSNKNPNVTADLLLTPKDPVWRYDIDPTVGAYIYNPNTSIDFDLNIIEQSSLILKILLYAGVVIRDPQIIQAASAEIQKEEINSKS